MTNNNYLDWSQEDLIKEIKKLESNKKFGIVWETWKEPEQVVERCKKELPVLKEIKEKGVTKNKNYENHVLINGDNYHAISVLNFTHKSKVDFIYIDPPYNTGARDWKYNNDYVDGEDRYKHSKWLSMMNNRLLQAKKLLKSDGIICVTIDDYEAFRLWGLLEEIFDEKNHLGTVVIRNNPKGRKTTRKVSLTHEYAIFYGKSSKSKIAKLDIKIENKTHNYKKDDDGSWYLPTNLRKQGVDSLATNKKGKISKRYYPIYYEIKTGKISVTQKLEHEIYPIDAKGQKRIWRRGIEDVEKMVEQGEIFLNETRNGVQIYYKFRGGLEGEPPQSIWYESKFSASEHGTQILDKILGVREAFPYPKSHHAVMQCIKIGTNNKEAVILDFFAGSGTTAHAVLELNKEDNGKRKFILATNNEVDESTLKELKKNNASQKEIESEGICDKVCQPRIKNLIEGYEDIKNEESIIFDKKLTPSILKDIDIEFENIENIQKERKNDFDEFITRVKGNKLELIGIENIVKGKTEGHNVNLKYFVTEFVDGAETDQNKRKLVEKTTEMLCLKEDCFIDIVLKKQFKIFKNNDSKHLGIIFDVDGIEDFKKELLKINSKIDLYIFSLDESVHEDEFKNVLDLVNLKAIPETILNTYRRIFK
jgi:adenine-specific DNA-methyltransferase